MDICFFLVENQKSCWQQEVHMFLAIGQVQGGCAASKFMPKATLQWAKLACYINWVSNILFETSPFPAKTSKKL